MGESSLTTGKHLWCYRAHCMQARTLKYDVKLRSATNARDVLVLVSLPLLLNWEKPVRVACLKR